MHNGAHGNLSSGYFVVFETALQQKCIKPNEAAIVSNYNAVKDHTHSRITGGSHIYGCGERPT